MPVVGATVRRGDLGVYQTGLGTVTPLKTATVRSRVDGELARIDQAEAAIKSDQAQACLLRFRPITMTTMAALLGGLPLAIGGGTGSELRRPLGIVIVGGLVFSQMLTLFTTPVVYLCLGRFRLRWLARVRPALARRGQQALTTLDVQLTSR